MSQTKISVREELCNYMYLLSLNITSRENLLKLFATDKGLTDPTVKAYMDEYYIYDAKYKMIQNNITASIEKVAPAVSQWDMDFATATVTLTHNGAIDKDAIAESIGLTVNEIDEKTAESLINLYDNESFDDETGLTNESCACSGSKSCSCKEA